MQDVLNNNNNKKYIVNNLMLYINLPINCVINFIPYPYTFQFIPFFYYFFFTHQSHSSFSSTLNGSAARWLALVWQACAAWVLSPCGHRLHLA